MLTPINGLLGTYDPFGLFGRLPLAPSLKFGVVCAYCGNPGGSMDRDAGKANEVSGHSVRIGATQDLLVLNIHRRPPIDCRTD